MNSVGIPSPSGQVLSLVSALLSPENHVLHVQAIQARDQALSASIESYANLCLQLALVMIASDHTPSEAILSRIATQDMNQWRAADESSVQELILNPHQWIVLGQTAGFILKNALVRPPFCGNRQACIPSGAVTEELQRYVLHLVLSSSHVELRNVASSIVASCAVSSDGVQPTLHVSAWGTLVPTLKNGVLQQHSGALEIVRKMLEDGPQEFELQQIDSLVEALIEVCGGRLSDESHHQVLQSLLNCFLTETSTPASLILHMTRYIDYLLHQTTSIDNKSLMLACRSLVTILEVRPDLLLDRLSAIVLTMLEKAGHSNPEVALEACEFWLVISALDNHYINTGAILPSLREVLPKLIPTLLNNMVYSEDQKVELQALAETDERGDFRPIFHSSRMQQVKNEEDSMGDDAFDQLEDDSWNVRKCAAASLDCLTVLLGGDSVLPILLPELEKGLASDEWVQEACILAIGAVAEGCHGSMDVYLQRLYPSLVETMVVGSIPPLQSTTAWSLGRYATWIVSMSQSESSGHLLAQAAEAFLRVLCSSKVTTVQVASCAAFGELIQASGELLIPFLEPILTQMAVAMDIFMRGNARSSIVVFGTYGTLADSCGAELGKDSLLALFVPRLLKAWDDLASAEQYTLMLPLMESLSSVAVNVSSAFDPFAVETFDKCMSVIEVTTLRLIDHADSQAMSGSELYDPIVCALDLLDSMVEGLGVSIVDVVSRSKRYGPQVLNVLLSLVRSHVDSVRMSALGLFGDLAKQAPMLLEPALPQLLLEAVRSTNIAQYSPSVCANAVWALGEVFVQCKGNAAIVEPIASDLQQHLLGLLSDVEVDGLVENAAACMGRLALVHPDVVAKELSRSLPGWCSAMGKVTDASERRDAFNGFLTVVYSNPGAIEQAATLFRRDTESILGIILSSIATWHIPNPEFHSFAQNDQQGTQPFPNSEAELGSSLRQFVVDMKSSVDPTVWQQTNVRLPTQVRVLMRDVYGC